MDNLSLMEAHANYQRAVEAYKAAIRDVSKKDGELLQREKEIHIAHWKEVLDGKMSSAVFNRILKNDAYQHIINRKNARELKALAKVTMDATQEQLNVVKRQVDIN